MKLCVWGKMCIWMMSKTVCNKTRLSSLFINYLAFWVSLMGLTVAILWKSGRQTQLYYMSCVRHLALVLICIYLLLTSQKSNEVNWKAIKSIPWAVHDLPNWHDLKSKLISKLRQNTVSSWFVRNSKCLLFNIFACKLFQFCDFTLPSFIYEWLLKVSKFLLELRQWKFIITQIICSQIWRGSKHH